MALENTSGSGTLTCAGYAPAKVLYELDLDWNEGVVTFVRGTVTGRNRLHLGRPQSELQLSDGRQVPIVFGGSYNRLTNKYQVRWPSDGLSA